MQHTLLDSQWKQDCAYMGGTGGTGGPNITYTEETAAILSQLEDLLCPVTLVCHHQVNHDYA